MHPIFKLGILEIPAYGSIIFIGLVVGTLIAAFTAKKYQIEKLDIVLSTILATVGLLVGAKLVYFITVMKDLPTVYRISEHNLIFVVYYALGGYVFYGGLIGALCGYLFYAKWFKLDFGSLINVITPVIPLVHAFGRIGCFMGGCCYGIHYHGPFSVHFPYNQFVEELGPAERFPVQLLEASLNFLLFLVLFFYARKVRKSGQILGIYLIGYAVIRFSLEFLRGDLNRGVWLFGISTSQIISLLLIPLGIYMIVRKTKKPISEAVSTK